MSNCHTNDATNSVPGSGFHLMAKPVGPLCNLDCSYCFYLEKESLYEERHRFRMSDTALDVYVRRYIESQPTPEVEFTWQGGEPTLMGLDFFEKAVALQRRYRNGKTIRNTLQTNGTLLDERWGAFLAAEGFLVGISLDGPRELHDLTRRDKQGRSSFDDTVRGLGILQRFNVPFNVLVTVSDAVSCQPLTIYRFLKGLGVRHMQFNPVVERVPRAQEQAIGLHFAAPPEFSRSPIVRKAIDQPVEMSTQSVVPEAWGDFLIAIHVMNFEWALAAWCELPATVCLFSERCGRAAIVEHDGSVYSCDHFMYPEYRLGNLQERGAAELLNSAQQQAFGNAKADALPGVCRRCEYRFACHGECPKNRFAVSVDGEPGLNFLCAGYLKYFRHITQTMNAMGKLLAHGQPAALIKEAFKGPLLVKL
jgi:uncharacterized protein